MPIDKYDFKELSKKQFNISIPVHSTAEWGTISLSNPRLPASFAELRNVAKGLFNRKHRPPTIASSNVRGGVLDLTSGVPINETFHGIVRHRFEECGESLYNNFFTALGNPNLTSAERAAIEADLDADTPTFGESFESDHFVFHWTNSSPNPSDNIADPDLVRETADHLEVAWQRFVDTFGRNPYIPEGQLKQEVIFRDIAGFGVASPPDGPIEFDAQGWTDLPGIRRPTATHELFHKLQYSYGYRTKWNPVADYRWFSEGSATWAEAFVCGQLSRTAKLTDLFARPDTSLFSLSYESLPFWLFFQTRQTNAPADNPLVSFLTKYELTGDAKQALRAVIDEDWVDPGPVRELERFFESFSTERITGTWRQSSGGGTGYDTILGPDGVAIDPALTVTNLPLFVGSSYVNETAVSSLGSDYYRFECQSDTDGTSLQLRLELLSGQGGISCFLGWEHAGAFVSSEQSGTILGAHDLTQPISLAASSRLFVVVTGRTSACQYRLSVTV